MNNWSKTILVWKAFFGAYFIYIRRIFTPILIPQHACYKSAYLAIQLPNLWACTQTHTSFRCVFAYINSNVISASTHKYISSLNLAINFHSNIYIYIWCLTLSIFLSYQPVYIPTSHLYLNNPTLPPYIYMHSDLHTTVPFPYQNNLIPDLFTQFCFSLSVIHVSLA